MVLESSSVRSRTSSTAIASTLYLETSSTCILATAVLALTVALKIIHIRYDHEVALILFMRDQLPPIVGLVVVLFYPWIQAIRAKELMLGDYLPVVLRFRQPDYRDYLFTEHWEFGMLFILLGTREDFLHISLLPSLKEPC